MNDHDNESLPAELLQVRNQIDAIDAELIELLSARFRLTHQIGRLKASERLAARDEQREADKLLWLRELCLAKGLNPELVIEIFSQIWREVVKNHKKLRQ